MPRQTPTPQLDLFAGRADDLPLFSGTPMKAPETRPPDFTPQPRQERLPEPDPEPPAPILRRPDDRMTAGRLDHLLTRSYRTEQGIRTLRQLIEAGGFTFKRPSIQTHSTKRIHLEYKRLAKPITYYSLWRADDTGLDVPKLVYDHLDLPERAPITHR